MTELRHLAEQLRRNSSSVSAVTHLYDELRTEFLTEADCPNYINEFTLGALHHLIHVVADQTARISDSLADAINDQGGDK